MDKNVLLKYYINLFAESKWKPERNITTVIVISTEELGVTMLVFYKNWQGIGESPVRNEFHREASAERWNGHSWQGIRRYPVSFCKTLT